MVNRTQTQSEKFQAGDRLRECRLWRGLSRDELIVRVEALPDNKGKVRSEKQIGYIESGARQMSVEYALLFSQALDIRPEYLLLKDDFRTEAERIKAITGKAWSRQDLIRNLIALHGYAINDVTSSQPIRPGEDGREYRETKFSITSAEGKVRFLSSKELNGLIKGIDDHIEKELLFQFRKLSDGAKEYWG